MVTDEIVAKATERLQQKGFLNIPVDKQVNLAAEITRLKKEKNAVILAHYYQTPDIQDIADYVGDSLGLSQQAAATTADMIVFAGVHFMGETAKILNPHKKVLLPDLKAGCSLAESAPPDLFKKFKDQHPDHIVITYINCTAEIKAMSDIICTSANAEKIVNSVPKDQPIIFAPDKNLGRYLINKTGRDMLLWDGACIVHEAFAIDKLLELHKQHPKAKIVAHPESETHILKVAHYVGSTTGMINFVKNDDNAEYIIATEAGILHQMSKEVPHKTLIPAPSHEDNTCACSECAFMRMNTMEKLYLCLKYELPEILVPEDIRQKALIPIQRMLEISKN
ncbi:quinolinate synthase NadA [Ohtaekwangia koreensis]|jgi:quinolinate synthase|nr:quinolinate synthase NadA [Ohtaekwangia koreensis]